MRTRQRRKAESGIGDLHEVHRLEQAIFPAQLELISIAEQQGALQQKLGHNRADIDRVDNRPRLQRTLAAHAVKVNRRLIEALDYRRIVIVGSVQAFQLDRVVGVRRR